MNEQRKNLEAMINAFILFPNKQSKKLEIKYNKAKLRNKRKDTDDTDTK